MVAAHALGIDLGGTTTTLAVIGPENKILWERRFPTQSEVGFDVFMGLVAEQAAAARASFPFDAAGVAAAAQIGAAGNLLTSPNLAFENVPLGPALTRALGVPVVVENDVNAAAYGEYLSAAAAREPFLAVYVGTGVGAGLVVGADVFRGADGFAAELGHVPVVAADGEPCGCGRRGCLEAYAGGRGILRRAAAAGRRHVSVDEVAAAADAGDDASRRILEEAAFYLGVALAAAVNLFNPGAIVVGGGVARAWPPLVDLAVERMLVSALTVSLTHLHIYSSTMGASAGVIGAAALARRAGALKHSPH